MTRKRIINFLTITEMNKTVFCRRVGISSSMLQYYLKGEREISNRMREKIDYFIDGYIERIREI